MDRKQKLSGFSNVMYFKWHEWVTKKVKENLRLWQAINHRYQLPHGRYWPHGRIILLFCWSNLILVQRAEDLVLPVPPTSDGRGLSPAQLTTWPVSSWGSLAVPKISPVSTSKWFCQIPCCSDGTLSVGVTKRYIFTVFPIFLAPIFKMCFSTDVKGHTMHMQTAKCCSWVNTSNVPVPFLCMQLSTRRGL